MKRLVTFLLAITTATVLLAGCSQAQPAATPAPTKAPASAAEPTKAAAPTVQPTIAAQPTAAPRQEG
ncbi:MAG TPA: hypothetical protein VHS06_06570 [Chloroflexota bacterium]|nr:hypothetical protein [Chloroflexota bacterium]